VELRRTPRAPIDSTVEFIVKGETARRIGQSRDISLGGMFVATTALPSFGAEVVVYVTLPGEKAPFALPGVVRWMRDGGMGVQFGLLGARETYAITEVVKKGGAPAEEIDVTLDE
jgi:type IV pilus assembly protein PilZ